MKKFLLFVAISLAIISASPGVSYTDNEARKIITEKGPLHREIFEIPLFVALPQRSSLLKTPTGAEDKQAKITLDASVLYVPIDVLMAEFTGEKLKARGLELKSESELLWNGSRAMLLKVFQTLGGGKVKGQWILAIDRLDHTWMVNGAYDAKNQHSSAEVLSILQSAWWEPGNVPFAALNVGEIDIDTSGTPFKLAKAASGALIYTKDGKLPTEAADKAIFIASKIQNLHIPASKRADFAKEKCADAALGNDMEIISENKIQIDGKEACEILATADSEEEETVIFQTMLFDMRDYNVLIGIAHADNEANVAHFKKLTEKLIAAPKRKG